MIKIIPCLVRKDHKSVLVSPCSNPPGSTWYSARHSAHSRTSGSRNDPGAISVIYSRTNLISSSRNFRILKVWVERVAQETISDLRPTPTDTTHSGFEHAAFTRSCRKVDWRDRHRHFGGRSWCRASLWLLWGAATTASRFCSCRSLILGPFLFSN